MKPGLRRQRVNLTLPTDVIEWLDATGNRSEAVVQLARARMADKQ